MIRSKLKMIDPAGATDGDVVTYDAATDRYTPAAPSGGGIVDSIVAGTNVTVDDTDPANPVVSATGGGGGGGSGRVLLKTVTLASAATPISFTSSDIPASGYLHLEVELLGRSAAASGGDALIVSLNGDTTDSNYATQRFQGSSTSATATLASNRIAGLIAGTSISPASAPSMLEMKFFDFLGTTWYKSALARSGYRGAMVHVAYVRNNTAPITSIDLTCGGNFVAGTVARLYGIPS